MLIDGDFAPVVSTRSEALCYRSPFQEFSQTGRFRTLQEKASVLGTVSGELDKSLLNFRQTVTS
jgi:hypothetical protein